MTQCQKLLMLCGPSCLGCGNIHVVDLFHHNVDKYIQLGRMRQCSPLIAKFVKLRIVDALLTLTLIWLKQPSFTKSVDPTNRIHNTDIQHCVCKYYHSHPGALLPLNFWSTAVHTIWVRHDIARSYSSAFCQQFTACRSVHYFLVNIARLSHLSSRSFFFSISMTCCKQFQLSQWCAQDLWVDLCSWIHGWMQHDSCHVDRFIMSTDHTLYDTYIITYLNVGSIFHH